MDTTVFLALVIIVASVASIWGGAILGWIIDGLRRALVKTWEPLPQNRMDAEGVQRTLARLRQARVNMERQGIKPLLYGHRGWQRVNPMASSDKPAKADKVVPIKRRT